MEKFILPNATPEERVKILEDSADKMEEFSYTKPFTKEQIQCFKDELSTAMIELNEIEDEFKTVKDEFKAKMKPLKEEAKILLTDIKNKAQFVKEKCFVVYEDGNAGYYNSEGVLVYQRPLLPGEKQKTVFSVLRTGTNN